MKRRASQDSTPGDPVLDAWMTTAATIAGSDHAMWRRVKLVPFSVVIPDDEQDKALQAKLKKERSGILNWLIEGCLDCQRNGLKDPKAVRIATADYRAEQDLVAAFVDDRCTIGPNAKALTADTSTASDGFRYTMSPQVAQVAQVLVNPRESSRGGLYRSCATMRHYHSIAAVQERLVNVMSGATEKPSGGRCPTVTTT